MATTLLHIGFSNAVLATTIALLAILASRLRRPALAHGLWLLALVKLLTPPLIHIPLPEVSDPSMALPALTTSKPKAIPVTPTPATTVQNSLKYIPPKVSYRITGPGEIVLAPLDRPTMSRAAKTTPDDDLPDDVLMTASFEEGQLPRATATTPITLPFPSRPPEPVTAQFGNITEPITNPNTWSVSWANIVVSVWLTGAAILLTIAAIRILRFTAILRCAQPVSDEVRGYADEVARHFGMRHTPEIRRVPGNLAPLVWLSGLRPIVYFPTELLERLNGQACKTLIAHEFAHVRRGDHWVRWLELLAVGLYWWFPVAWIARRRLQEVEEQCCDAWVCAALPNNTSVYAEAILDTIDFLADAPAKPMPALASGLGTAEQLKSRLLNILHGPPPHSVSWLARAGLLTLAVMLLPVSMGGRVATAQEPAKPTHPISVVAPKIMPQAPVAPPPVFDTEPRRFVPQATILQPTQGMWWQVALSPDGKHIAAAVGQSGEPGLVLIWEYATGNHLLTIREPNGTRTLAFSLDGKWLVTGNFDNAVRFYEFPSGRLHSYGFAQSGGHSAAVNSIAFAPNGKNFVSGGADRAILVWDMAKFTESSQPGTAPRPIGPIARLRGHSQGVLSVSVSCDGKSIVSGSLDNTARVWNLPQPSADGKPVEVTKARAEIRGHMRAVQCVAFSPSGKQIATGSWDGNVKLWDSETLKEQQTLDGNSSGVMDLTFTPDGKSLVVATGTAGQPTEAVRVWKLATSDIGREFDAQEGLVRSLVISPDGKDLIAMSDARLIRVTPLVDGMARELRAPPMPTAVPQALFAVAVSPDGKTIATAGDANAIVLWDNTTKAVQGVLSGHTDVITGLAFSPDGKTLASSSYDRSVRLWDVAKLVERRQLSAHRNWVFAVAFSPDGKTLASAGYDRTLRLWQPETGEELAVLAAHTAGVRAIAFSPRGDRLVSAGADRIIRVWDVQKRQVSQLLKGHKSAVRSVVFSSDGQTLYSAGEDLVIRRWDVAKQTSEELISAPDVVTCLAVTPGGTTLLAGTLSRVVLIVDVQTRTTTATLTGHSDTVAGLALLPDNSALVSVSADRSTRLWPAVRPPSPAMITQAIGEMTHRIEAVQIFRMSKSGAEVLSKPSGPSWYYRSVDRMHGIEAMWIYGQGRPLAVQTLEQRPAAAGFTWVHELTTLTTEKLEADVIGTRWTPKTGISWVELSKAPRPGESAEERAKQRADLLARLKAASRPVNARSVNEDESGPRTGLGLALHPEPLWRYADSDTPDGSLHAFTDAGNPEVLMLLEVRQGKWQAACAGLGMAGAEVRFDDKVIWEKAAKTSAEVSDSYWWQAAPPLRERIARAVLTGQKGPVWFSAISNNGRLLATGANDRTVHLRTASPGRPAVRFEEHPPVVALAASPDLKTLVSAHTGGQVLFWNVQTGRKIKSIEGQDRVTSMQFTPVGDRLVIAGGNWARPQSSEQAFIRIFDASGMLIKDLPHGPQMVYGLAMRPNGKQFATAHHDKLVRIWDSASGKLIHTLDGHSNLVNAVNYSPDGATLVSVGHAGELRIWDSETAEPRGQHKFAEWRLVRASFSPDGKTVALAANPPFADDASTEIGEVWLWDVAGQRVRHTLKGHSRRVLDIAFSPDGKTLASSGGYPRASGEVFLWDVASGMKLVELTDHKFWVSALAFSPDGQTLYTGDGLQGRGGELRAYDFAGIRPRAILVGHTNFVASGAFSPQGTFLATAGWDRKLMIWDLARVLAEGGVFKPEQTARVLHGHESGLRCVRFSPDGRYLASCSEDGMVILWEPATGREVRRWQAHGVPTYSLAFSPDSKSLATVGGEYKNRKVGEVRIWNPATGELTGEFPSQPSAVWGVTFSPDGKTLLTAQGDEGVKVWDVATKEVRLTLTGQRLTRSLTMSKDGRHLAVGGSDGSLLLYQTTGWQPIDKLVGHREVVFSVTFSPDGRTLMSSSGDSTARMWDVR